MPRESAHDKGRRLLAEGRLRVTRVDGRMIHAVCRGDSAQVYQLGHDAGGWTCTCPAMTRCGHLVALQLTVVVGGAA
jgi:uncharacterized Zn finger protein